MAQGIATDGYKKTPDDYIKSAQLLIANMKAHGYDAEEPILIDDDGEIWNGAHRIACAAALGLSEIPVFFKRGKVWAPAWDRKWMLDHGIIAQDLKRLDKDMEKLRSV